MPMSTTVVSGLFWPSFQEDALTLPPAARLWNPEFDNCICNVSGTKSRFYQNQAIMIHDP